MTCRWLHVCLGFILVCSTAGDCLFPPNELPNGRFLYQKKTDANQTTAPHNYLLRFVCRRGYTRIGSRHIICTEDKWSDFVPTCIKMQCSEPPEIKNAKSELHAGQNNLLIIGAQVVYSCDVGFELLNETASTLICVLEKGSKAVRWEGEMPACKEKVSCPDPGKSKDGDRDGNCCLVGNVLRYSCNEDYELIGHEEIECLPTGNWTFKRPLCQPLFDHCTMPPAIPHGAVKGNKEGDYYQLYDTVQIVCEPGYSHPDEGSLIECEEGGEWELDFGECTEIFCDPPEPLRNGNITELQFTNLTSFPFNFELTYVCDKGFRLVGGDSWRFCDSSGWSGKNPHCEVIRCPDPGVPDHGSRIGNNFEIGSKILFKCFTGYDLIGLFERYCKPNGQWTGELVRCDTESNYCPDPGIPINGYKNSTDYDMGSLVGFRCRPGYIRIGSEARVCQPNRTWSGEETTCLGKYDYDNSAEIRDSLKIAMTKKAAEQERKLKEYRESLLSTGRAIPMNHPGRLVFYFVFDVSGSVGKDNFDKSIEFAKAIVKKVGITVEGARAGALTFSSLSHIEFWPFDYNTTEGVLNALDRVNYTGGGTSASSAFTHLRTEIIPTTQGVLEKKGQKSIVFILTDGRANMGGDPQEEAKTLKKAGVEIYCIGITGDFKIDSLLNIASEPKKEHVFILKNYQTLAWLVQELTNGTVDYSACGLGMEDAGNRLPRGQSLARIVGGIKVTEPWPWMVAIYFLKPGSVDPAGAELKCGGSIIDKYFILTAAHCMFYYDQNSLKWIRRDEKEVIVKLGLTHVENETYIQEPEVKLFYTHSKHRPSAIHHDYDVALLQLNTPIEFNAYVRPVCLPPKDLPASSTFYKPYDYGVATGFGHQNIVLFGNPFELRISEYLKEIVLPIQPSDSCIQSLVDKDQRFKDYFTDRMFCAGDGQGGNDTCQGDSGGPFMQSQINNEGYRYWTQVGIVSWGLGCGEANSYGFYSHVQKLIDWIDKTIKNARKENF